MITFDWPCWNQWDAELELLMVPSGELHIAAVDYSHTHHPYFCIVKHRCDICTSCWCLLIHGGQSQPWWLWWTAWSSLLLMIMLMLVVDDDDDDRDKDGDVQGLWGQSRESPLPPHSQRWSHLNLTVSSKASSWSWNIKCDWYWSTKQVWQLMSRKLWPATLHNCSQGYPPHSDSKSFWQP